MENSSSFTIGKTPHTISSQNVESTNILENKTKINFPNNNNNLILSSPKKFFEDFEGKKAENNEGGKHIKKKKNDYIYDFVKIRVTLDNHFYILSRLLISRMLTLCKIPKLDAVEVARELKKKLIEQNKLEIPQQEVEATLFNLIRMHKYHENHIQRYQMIAKFYQKRVPLIIIFSGAPCVGKSNLATYLAERMNVSNILQTEIVEHVMKSINLDLLPKQEKPDESEFIIENFETYCKLVRRGVNIDIMKCLIEGKPVIIEGDSVNLRDYVTLEKQSNTREELGKKSEWINNYINNKIDIDVNYQNVINMNASQHTNDKFEIKIPMSISKDNDNEIMRNNKLQTELKKIDQRGAIIVPILLILNRKDHMFYVENKYLRFTEGMGILEKKEFLEKKLNRYQAIQEYLIKNSYDISTILPSNINKYDESLDIIHTIILEKIEASYNRKDF